jgi:hypothetical protein
MPSGKRSPNQKPPSGKSTPQERKSSLWSRLAAPFKRLLGRSRTPGKVKAAARASLSLGGQKRTLAQWKELRRSTTAEVKAHLAEQQPVPAIKKLTRALLEDPQHPAYHELLKKAVEQRRQRRIKAGRKDPWADLPKDLKQEALQLEAFSAYVDELEQLFDKAGIPPLSAPPPPEQRQDQKAYKRKQKLQAEGAKSRSGPPTA